MESTGTFSTYAGSFHSASNFQPAPGGLPAGDITAGFPRKKNGAGAHPKLLDGPAPPLCKSYSRILQLLATGVDCLNPRSATLLPDAPHRRRHLETRRAIAVGVLLIFQAHPLRRGGLLWPVGLRLGHGMVRTGIAIYGGSKRGRRHQAERQSRCRHGIFDFSRDFHRSTSSLKAFQSQIAATVPSPFTEPQPGSGGNRRRYNFKSGLAPSFHVRHSHMTMQPGWRIIVGGEPDSLPQPFLAPTARAVSENFYKNTRMIRLQQTDGGGSPKAHWPQAATGCCRMAGICTNSGV